MKAVSYLAALSASIFISTTTIAEEAPGYYGTIYMGASNLSASKITETRTNGITLDERIKFKNGGALGGALGYRYGNGWAAELAWDYRTHGLKNKQNMIAGGDFASNTLFVNGYYRFTKIGSIRPFVGLGVGWAQEIDIDIDRSGQSLSYQRKNGSAVQAIVGGELEISSNLALVGDLRLMKFNTGSFKAERPEAGGVLTNKPKYQPVSIHLGMSYKF